MNTTELIKLIQSDNLMNFYKGRDWMSLRLKALRRDNNECPKCREKGKYRRADCVHHMKEVKDHPTSVLDLDNVKSLCNTCHNEEHDRLKVWERNKTPKIPRHLIERRRKRYE